VNDHPLTDKDSRNRTKRDCLTEFRTLLALPDSRAALVEARLLTGRRHQIRRHLSNGRHQILGDTLYGKGRDNTFFRENYQLPRLFLHARRLEFTHPETNARITVESPLAPDLRTFLYKLPDFDRAAHPALCDLGDPDDDWVPKPPVERVPEPQDE